MKKSSCSFNMVKLTENQWCCLIGMLDARMRIHHNIDPNWAIKVCKWGVTITICSFPHIGKRNGLHKRISTWGDNWFSSNHPPNYIEPISMVNTIYCNNGNGYFSPLSRHRIINTWSILTNEVSKLLWFNSLLHAVFFFKFEQWLTVLIL